MSKYRWHDSGTGASIEYHGLPPIPFTTVLLTAMIVSFVGVAGWMILNSLAERLPPDWYLRSAWWWQVVLYLVILFGPLLLVTGIPLWRLQRQFSYVKSVHWDPVSGLCCLITARFGGLFKRRRCLSLSNVQLLSVEIGEEDGRPIPLAFWLQGTAGESLGFHLAIQHVDQRSEALDVFFTLARYCGLTHYTTLDQRTVSLVVEAAAEASPTSSPIPVSQGLANFELDQTASRVESPEPDVGHFDPARYSDWNMSLGDWAPSTRVQFRRAAATWWESAVVGGFFGVVALIALAASASDRSTVTGWLVAVGVGIFVCLVAMVIYRVRYRSYDVDIDLVGRRVTVSSGATHQVLAFSSIHRIALREFERRTTSKQSIDRYRYQCRLLLASHTGEEILLTQNDTWSSSSDEQRLALEPLAAALAKAMGLPWRWLSHQPSAASRVFSELMLVLVMLFFLGLIGFFAWGYWTQTKSQAAWREVASRLEAAGAKVTWAGLSVGDIPLYGDGFLVEVRDPEFSDADLPALLAELESISLFGLDLSGTAITDKGVSEMIGAPGLLYLNLSGTEVTPQVVDTLAQLRLGALDLRQTAVRLEHLTAFAQDYALVVLFISDDTVSESNLTHVLDIPRLQAVLISDERTTERLLGIRRSELAEDEDLSAADPSSSLSESNLKVAGEIRFQVH